MTRSDRPAPMPDTVDLLDLIANKLDHGERQMEIAEMSYRPVAWGTGKVSVAKLLEFERELLHVATCAASAINVLDHTARELHQSYVARPHDPNVKELARRQLALRQRIARLLRGSALLADMALVQEGVVASLETMAPSRGSRL